MEAVPRSPLQEQGHPMSSADSSQFMTLGELPRMALPGSAPSPTRKPKTTGRSYNRWHLEPQVDTEEEGWLLTYLDVITLMLVMMVVMLSFAGPPGGTKAPDQEVANSPTAATAQAAAGNTIVPPVPLPIPLPYASNPTGNGSGQPEDPVAKLKLETLGSNIQLVKIDDVIRFRISSELLFGSGSAVLNPAAHPVLDELVTVFKAQPDMRLVVEGHTDSSPIKSERFPSNWELSSARAAAVARYLIGQGVAPQRLQASGYADTRPMAAPWNPVDRAANRRVELTMETPKVQPPT